MTNVANALFERGIKNPVYGETVILSSVIATGALNFKFQDFYPAIIASYILLNSALVPGVTGTISDNGLGDFTINATGPIIVPMPLQDYLIWGNEVDFVSTLPLLNYSLVLQPVWDGERNRSEA